MDPTLLAVLIGGLVVVMIVCLYLAFSKGGDEAVADRLDTLVGRNLRKESSADMLLKQVLQDTDRQSLLDRLTPEMLSVNKWFEQADANIKPSALFGISIGLAVFGAVMSLWLVNPYVMPVGAAVLFVLPWLWLYMKRAKRLKKFAAQLPDAMELVARALRAGHSLASGIHCVAEEMPAPISREFSRVYDEQNLGIALEDALKGMCDRVPNLDLRFFVTSVAIQRQTGGDLAEILERIGHIIRERFKILGQVQALTAEGRLSGIVLIAMPIGLFLMMLYMKPDYIELLWKDELGQKMSIGAIILVLIGAFAIKKIIDIKV
ncbi:Type II secretion system protein OS=Planctomyces limnophilus (strain ATCC 43296 / DSM 3776 / IFAM 1008 / 290) GN=Plim_1917 PE=4 SV=1: T2SF [Gemmataceae bacterium]|nr:Type II secretion system protein OS=Planctomyces limnophilus (strain ATCC 43296 / DSM 3776 / IFAM 1008 / 290) GN=Plim_1917 PE=4 SV=1: T2SF [Gemmataceae bacterium]VTT99937.1 Type II secretion system protein OS=Planctomyces limnophilus (strain ATCC 43296 / DSM 3776 / IFAM 1008 / 290) GN=Plim_1917 PE=4 SV=1: T2SF [Gemmataceae bacterium]